uniref:Uncharacterized protein n=1 Tax=Chromera velia CCMP2878 TaxID=1169474 RepID=A0A0G4HZ46_9ALVE|eukprot:Cvel_9645.t1-p1 / transcript=Cvel_9645.t1 / gene=Cvel_9645 / organism=Chromera_velia_CCMP2878 / gene_product=hypothetical protein / transcript_product=hypothetical protein / location=Cvel_scaffold561:25421-27395(+) / protein_length=229 / sequence_SO=supercontig / SO=protein_coding / is_pseudo=false
MASVSPFQQLIVAESRHAAAFLAPRPLLRGHCLCVGTRKGADWKDLKTMEEVWSLGRKVARSMKKRGATAVTLSCTHFRLGSLFSSLSTDLGTDAKAEGCTPGDGDAPPPLVLHVIPRQEGDLEKNDEIYRMIEEQEEGRVCQDGESASTGGDCGRSENERGLLKDLSMALSSESVQAPGSSGEKVQMDSADGFGGWRVFVEKLYEKQEGKGQSLQELIREATALKENY